VLTLVGWGLLIKGLIRFCAPTLALRMMAEVSAERSWGFQVAGAALVGLAGLLGYGSTLGNKTPDPPRAARSDLPVRIKSLFFHGCLERGLADASVGNAVSGRLFVF
jgi:hypothetical protein